jgi:hypothetical protein
MFLTLACLQHLDVVVFSKIKIQKINKRIKCKEEEEEEEV